MKKKLVIGLCIIFLLIGCSSGNVFVETEEAVSISTPTERVLFTLTPTLKPTLIPTTTSTSTMTPLPTKEAAKIQLDPFVIDFGGPSSEIIPINVWDDSKAYQGFPYSLPIDPTLIKNPDVITGLTDEERAYLYQNGFVVIHSQEESFLKIRESVGGDQGQPYFLSVDSALHGFHLQFDELLKEFEKEMKPRMTEILASTMAVVLEDWASLKGTDLEKDLEVAAQYLGVGLRLFDPQAEIPGEIADVVDAQIALILEASNANGIQSLSLVIPNFKDDYSAYKPVGHYAGDEDLENYFRGMTWLGRGNFSIKNTENSRAPLIITLALRRAKVDSTSADQAWAEIHKNLTFLIGATDDPGPVEYAALMDAVYGTELELTDLINDDLWVEFVNRTEELPAPQINSTFVDWVSKGLESEKGWRFMGQRFTWDAMIFQNLIYDMVLNNEEGENREIPTGLDVMAVLGSDTAYETLEALGETQYENYVTQFEMLSSAVEAQTEEEWRSKVYDSWLFTLRQLVTEKDNSYPAFMRTPAWGYKDLNTSLGSWAQLKHDTILYTKMADAAGGGGPPTSPSAPGYVEPNPEAFYRLGYLADELSWFLIENNIIYYNGYFADYSALGKIAEKELNGEELTEFDYEVILDPTSYEEYKGTEAGYFIAEPHEVPVIAAVSGAGAYVLESGVGYVDRIYVVAPFQDGLYVTQGGVFSYYEFTQLRNQRLTDEEWREKLESENPDLPSWASEFVFEDGNPVDVVVYRIGDVYFVLENGPGFKLYTEPDLESEVYLYGGYFSIVDGPIVKDEIRWWKINYYNRLEVEEAWIIENEDAVVRSW